MHLLTLTLRHFMRHWRLNLLAGLTLLLATAFLASLPLYTLAVAGRTLQLRLESALPAARNIQVSRDEGPMTAAVWGDMRAKLGDLVEQRVTVRDMGEDSLRTSHHYFRANGEEVLIEEEAYLRVWSFSTLQSNTEVIAGRFPRTLQPDPLNLSYQVQEIAVGQAAAERFGIGVGDQLRTFGDGLHLNVVGILAPQDIFDPVWQTDLSPFQLQRIERGNSPDLVNLSVLVPESTMNLSFPEHNEYWRVLTRVSAINMASVDEIRQNLDDLQSRWSSFTIETSLMQIIDAHLSELAIARVSVFLLSVQSLIFVLYTVSMVSSYLLDSSRAEIATLVDRGFAGAQITLLFALEGLILAFLWALPLGPLVARGVIGAWAGSYLSGPIPVESWLFAGLAAVFGWIALVGPIFLATRRSSRGWQQRQSRPSHQTAWQRSYVDVFLLVLGGLILWQLRETGSFLSFGRAGAGAAAGNADPLLLLGPSLLLLALALLFLRLFPLLLRGAAWVSRQFQGLLVPFGFNRLARDPTGPSRVVLLASLAAGLTFFALAYDFSLAVRQTQMAFYNTGSDLVVNLPQNTDVATLQTVAAIPGVYSASNAYWNDRLRYSAALGQQATLLAVDPETFPTVSGYPPAITALRLTGLMEALQRAPDGAVPAIFSASTAPREKQVGDQIIYFVGTQPVRFEVRGIVVNFPALQDAFIVANRTELLRVLDLERVDFPFTGAQQVWLVVDGGAHERVRSEVARTTGATVAGDTQALLRSYAADLPAAGTLGALKLNAAILTILSVAVFFFIHYFTARRRLYEFSLLRAIGLSARQLLGLLSLEGVIMMSLGLLAGTAVGYGLALLMRPFFSTALAGAVAGADLHAILINTPQLLIYYAVAVGAYLFAMLLSSFALVRAGIHRALRLGEE